MKRFKNSWTILGLYTLASFFSGCSTDININDYIDKNTPLKLSIGNPLVHIDIPVDSEKYKKLIQWGNENTKEWQWTPASYVADIYVGQGNFRLLHTLGSGVVIGFTDKEGKPKQYTKAIKKGELDFLIK